MSINQEKLSTKQKILASAANLFAVKGFTETSIREIAANIGLRAGSIYNHFESKNALLECILKDYLVSCSGAFSADDMFIKLKENPTADGMISCLQVAFDPNYTEYNMNALYVILQEQHRNPIVRSFISDDVILYAEEAINTAVAILKELHIIRQDTDPDFWAKASSSIFYTFASRMSLGIGDTSPDFVGMGMVELLRYLFDLLLTLNRAPDFEPN